MKNKEKYQESLSRAVQGQTLTNYPAIFQGLMSKGIAEPDIQPRENVFTYNAWKALGRHVRKGEHGVRVNTFAHPTRTEIDPETGEERTIEIQQYPMQVEGVVDGPTRVIG